MSRVRIGTSLGVKNKLTPRPQNRILYHFVCFVFLIIHDKHPCPYDMGVPPPPVPLGVVNGSALQHLV